MDVTNIAAGRWALSRPVQDSGGGWTTIAAQQQLARATRMYWPPRNGAGAPLVNAVLVHGVGNLVAPPDGDTVVFPRDIATTDETLGDLTAQQRQNWRDTLEAWLTGYTFTDYDGQVRNIPAFSAVTANYTLSTTLRQVARDIFKHFAHSVSRPRLSEPENHNTEYTDNFTTDPFAARWTQEVGSAAWDAGNNEIDCDMSTDILLRYQANSPGSIEHEAQITGIGSTSNNRLPGAAVRLANSGANDGYVLYYGSSGSILTIRRYVAGASTDLYGEVQAGWSTDWFTQRLSAEGGNGANVTLNGWVIDHGASKPSDPGWQGANGTSTTGAVVDSDASRLDDDTLHTQGGIGGRASDTSEEDTRHSYFKVRAISDRVVISPPTLLFRRGRR